MKKIKWLTILMILVLLVGCGKSANDMAASSDASAESFADGGDILEYGSASSDAKTEENTSKSVSTNRKIIERVYMDVETKEFDELIDKLYSEIQMAGGYVERSSMSGNGLEYEGNRYADFTIRIPSEKSDGFTKFVSANSTVTNKEIVTDDVTLSYVDMESRVSALETEKAALEKLLAEAEVLEDIIKIQDRLTDVIYEIESYQSELRTYDNLIDYTTVGIYVREVERVSIVEEQTVWQEVGTKFSDSVRNIRDGVTDIFVFIVGNILYIAIIGSIALVVVTIVKKKKR